MLAYIRYSCDGRVVLSYAPNQKDAIQLQAVGKGGLPGLCEQLHNDQVRACPCMMRMSTVFTRLTNKASSLSIVVMSSR